MDNTERQVIDELFAKLRQVENQTGPRDDEADTHIRSWIARQPAAPYYMAQTIVVQEQALAAAQARIEELQHELSARPASGGFLTGLFGGGGETPAAGRRSYPAADPRVATHARFDQRAGQRPGGGSGFLAGAMQTAIGVAGGVMLANALGSMFTPDEAAAAESGFDDTSAADADFGADDGDFGSFDDF